MSLRLVKESFLCVFWVLFCLVLVVVLESVGGEERCLLGGDVLLETERNAFGFFFN